MPLIPPTELASDFTLSDINGQPFTLSAQRGHIVVLVLNRGFA